MKGVIGGGKSGVESIVGYLLERSPSLFILTLALSPDSSLSILLSCPYMTVNTAAYTLQVCGCFLLPPHPVSLSSHSF